MTNTSTAKQPLKWLRICIAQFDPLLDSYVDVDVVHRDQSRPIGAALADLYRARSLSSDRAFRKPSSTFFWVFDPKNDSLILQPRHYSRGVDAATGLDELCNAVVLRAVELALPDEHGRALVVIDPFEYTGRLYDRGEPSGYHLSLLGLAAGTLDARAPAPAPVPTSTPVQRYFAAKEALGAAMGDLVAAGQEATAGSTSVTVLVNEANMDQFYDVAQKPDAVLRVGPFRLDALRRMGFEVEVLYTVPSTQTYRVEAGTIVPDKHAATDSYIRLRVPPLGV